MGTAAWRIFAVKASACRLGAGGEAVWRGRLRLNQVELETWSNNFHAIIIAISASFCFILVPSLFFLPSHLCPCFPYLHRSIFKVSQFFFVHISFSHYLSLHLLSPLWCLQSLSSSYPPAILPFLSGAPSGSPCVFMCVCMCMCVYDWGHFTETSSNLKNRKPSNLDACLLSKWYNKATG